MSDGMLKGLAKPTMIGTVLQVAMVLLGKVSPEVGQNFAIGGTTIAAVTGVLASLMNRQPAMGGAVGGGAIAAGVSALIGTVVSMATGQTGMDTIMIGTGSSVVAGALGGVVGQLFGGRKTGA
ncbi:MAG TPA: hypothetical protein VFO06_12060 [Gemmatimonadales bacterium]|nr:hypothetical protein [Gemmatimonadales bacterium]